MTGREYLSRIRELSNIVRSYDEEYQTLMSRLTSITYRQKDVNVQTSKNDHTPETIEKMSNVKILLVEKLREFAELRIEAEGMMRKIDDYRYIAVISKYYFQAKTIEQVAVDMDMSYRWVCDLKREAVMEFEKIYKKNKKS